MSRQPGARRDVQVRFDDDGAQRLVRDAAAVALRVAALVLARQTGQSEMPSTLR